jgi:histidine ammonia-lyase
MPSSLQSPAGVTPVTIDGASLTLDNVHMVAVDRAPVAVGREARDRMLRTRAVVDAIVRRNDAVYGVTTGFGKLSEVSIPPGRLAELQVNLVRSHAAGVGPLLPE